MTPGRAWLVVPLLLAVLVAGCGGPLSGEVVDHQVTVFNDGDSPREVHVTIARDGSTVLDETNEVPARGRWDVAGLDEAGDYRVRVETAAGRPTTASYSLPLVEGDRRSFLHVRVGQDGTLDSELLWED